MNRRTVLGICILFLLLPNLGSGLKFVEPVHSENQPPNQPSNISPANGATDVVLRPPLQSSDFFDPDSDGHAASQWQITEISGDYSSPVFDSGTDTTHLTQIRAPLITSASYGVTYYWRVKYQDSRGAWSYWSIETHFTICSSSPPNNPPDQPYNILPSNGATEVELRPTLQASVFHDPDPYDIHAWSQWQVTLTSGDYSNPVFDTSFDDLHLTQCGPFGIDLEYHVTYYWRVRYRDSRYYPGSADSAWSIETQFTTISGSAVQRKLTVSSAHDSPSPPNGDNYRDDGSSVTCSVTSPVTEGGVVYTCSGWSGTGSVPSSGSSTSVTFTITQDSTTTWNWIVTPAGCGRPVLTASVQISSNGGYSVGDTLIARFTIQNQGTEAIYLDKLLFGGRFNGGTLPGGGFPDFSYSSVTLQVGQIYPYEGTLYLTEAGYYQFFVAYYIANPTEAERVRCALDPSNWNTCIDLAPGLTDSDRTWSVQVVVNPGNLRAVSIEPVQVVWGADLVQDKATDFRIGYESTFDVPVEAYIRLETPGFIPNAYPFKYNFAPGSHNFVIGNDIALSPFFLARTKPEATFRFTIDPDNLVAETDESDNTFPHTGLIGKAVTDTRSIRILFVPVVHENEPVAQRITTLQMRQYVTGAERFLRATYPLAETALPVYFSPTQLLVPTGRDWRWVVNNLRERAFTGGFLGLFRTQQYDRVVGLVSSNHPGFTSWTGRYLGFDSGGFAAGIGGSAISALVEANMAWTSVVAHEVGHTYELYEDYPRTGTSPENWNDAKNTNVNGRGSGYWVLGREPKENLLTFMNTAGDISNRWVDSRDYNWLMKELGDGTDPEVLLLGGVIFKNNTATFSSAWYRLSEGTEDIEAGGVGNYYLVLLDAVNNTLSRVGFNATFGIASNPPIETDEACFGFRLQWVNGTRYVQLQNASEHVLASRIVSQNPPTVSVILPNGGEAFIPGTNYTITWTASDPDGDPITYGIAISNDGGITWIPIATDLNHTSFVYDFKNLRGGDQYLLGILASDGVNVGTDTSNGFFTISSFTIDVITPPQVVSSGGKANYTLNITSYGGFNDPIILNATSSTTDHLIFRWINGSEIIPVPNGSIEVILEIEVPYLTEGGNHTVFLLGTSGNSTEVAIAYLFASSHDLAISHPTPSKTVVGKGFSMTVNVTVENQGNFGETFTVSLYGNQTLILKSSTYLSPQNSTTVALVWNTSGFAYGNYSISACASPVEGETDTTDNNLTDGWILVTIPGDVDGDLENGHYDVDLFDAVRLLACYGAKEGGPDFDPNCDIDNSGQVFLFDAVILLSHYGQKYP